MHNRLSLFGEQTTLKVKGKFNLNRTLHFVFGGDFNKDENLLHKTHLKQQNRKRNHYKIQREMYSNVSKITNIKINTSIVNDMLSNYFLKLNNK